MTDIKIQLNQINTSSIASSVFASNTDVDTVQSNLDSFGTYANSTFTTNTHIDTKIAELVDSAPAALDTLNELAAALGDDANFSTTIVNAIGTVSSNVNTVQDNVATNVTNINTVQDNVAGLVTGLSGANTNINTVQDNVATNVTNINTVQDNVAGLVTGLSGANTNINTVQDNVATNVSNINTVQDNVATNVSSINTVQSNLDAFAATANTDLENNAWVNANDFSTFTTLSGFINTVQDNVDGITGGASLTDDTSTDATYYPGMSSATTGEWTTAYVSSTKLTFNPSTGRLSSTDFNSLSDINFKDNVYTIHDGINVITEVNSVSFNWKDTGQRAYGVIAQEVEKILPEIVQEDSNGTKSVSYSQLIPHIISAIQHLNKELNELKEEVRGNKS